MLKAITAVAVAAASLMLVLPASAAPSRSSISLVVVPALAAAATTGPAYGGQVTFSVSTSETRPWVNVDCYQNGVWVYDAWHGFFTGYYTDPIFTLSSQTWQSGAANCTARLVQWTTSGKQRTLATTSFDVAA